MTTRRVSLHEAPAWLRAKGEAYKEAGIKGLRSTAMRMVQMIVTEIIPAQQPPPVDRHTYAAGWKVNPLPTGATVTNHTAHAPFIEYGVQAANVRIGRAMIDALAEWVRRKGIGNTVTRKGNVKKVSKTAARGIAWAIAKSMQKKGIFQRNNPGGGLRILEQATERCIPRIMEEEIRKEIRRAGL